MDRRKFIKASGWSMLGIAASGSMLGSCAPGSKEAKKIMPTPSDLKMFWGDLHNHCNLTYGHGDMRDAFEAAKGQLDFVSVTPHAMWPDIPGKNDPRLSWVIDYHTDAFRRLRKGGYQKYQEMTKEYNEQMVQIRNRRAEKVKTNDAIYSAAIGRNKSLMQHGRRSNLRGQK